MTRHQDSIKELIALNRPFSAAEAKASDINTSLLAYYCRVGVFERLGRGVYTPTQSPLPSYPELEQLQLKGTRFVVCLLSALRLHEFTTQSPTSLWIAIAQGARLPQTGYQLPECIRLTPAPFSYGIEDHLLDGKIVQVYSPAKTVADCFKFRNKIGIDVAIEALRDGYQQKRFHLPELMQAAKVNRVVNIITPYIESLIV